MAPKILSGRGGFSALARNNHSQLPQQQRAMHTNANQVATPPSNCARPDVKNYHFMECIGVGTYGIVYRAYLRTDPELVYAIKSVDRTKLNKASQQLVISEIGILKTLDNPFVCKMHDFTWDNDKIYLILEYCSGGSLAHFISKRRCLPESLCRKVIQQLACALKYMRKRNISHFDLKPHNILLSRRRDPIVKVADFGFAQSLASEDGEDLKQKGLRGSPLYMAPEMIMGQEYDARVDLWSVGVIWYECLFGRAPFASKTTDELIAKVQEGAEVDLPHVDWLSAGCLQLLRGLLERDPERRISFDDFFGHSYLDLQHMPDGDSAAAATDLITRAVNLEQNATEADAVQCRKDALRLYCEGLAYLIPLCTYEEDVAKKQVLRTKIVAYMKRAEELKNHDGHLPFPVLPPPPLPNSEPPADSPVSPSPPPPPPRPPPPIQPRQSIRPEFLKSSTFQVARVTVNTAKSKETVKKDAGVINHKTGVNNNARRSNRNFLLPTSEIPARPKTAQYFSGQTKVATKTSAAQKQKSTITYIDDPCSAVALNRYYDALERRHESVNNAGGTSSGSTILTRMQYRAVVAMRDALTTGIIAQKLDAEKVYEEAFDKYQQALDVIISQLSQMPDDNGTEVVSTSGSSGSNTGAVSIKGRLRSQAAFWLGRAEALKPFAQLAQAERREWDKPPSDLNQLTFSDTSWGNNNTTAAAAVNGTVNGVDVVENADPQQLYSLESSTIGSICKSMSRV